MQFKKENTYNMIITVARSEFFTNGYPKTSMRTIARKAKVGLSNIYNYFGSKNEILQIILQPVLLEINKMFDEHNNDKNINLKWAETEDIFKIEEFKYYIHFVKTYREELDLLFHKCSGSKYENIKEQIIEKYATTSHNYLKLIHKKYPKVNKNISDFFIHTFAVWWVNIISEMVSHELTEQEMVKFVNDYIVFTATGWKEIMHL